MAFFNNKMICKSYWRRSSLVECAICLHLVITKTLFYYLGIDIQCIGKTRYPSHQKGYPPFYTIELESPYTPMHECMWSTILFLSVQKNWPEGGGGAPRSIAAKSGLTFCPASSSKLISSFANLALAAVKNVYAVPLAPALPVRPMRCT